eukprot:SAG31_NODE_29680_length_391_cov_1.102740_1_plen_69_part_10
MPVTLIVFRGTPRLAAIVNWISATNMAVAALSLSVCGFAWATRVTCGVAACIVLSAVVFSEEAWVGSVA